jgi:mannose/fructose/N-acetylgalactosamine-specific phosphotransferase system component IIB
MDVQLFRIDDRLIHGQVVLSWAKHLKSERIILCDDEVAENDWEKELYISCVPQSLSCMVYSTKTASEYLLSDLTMSNRTIVLVKSPAVLREITDYGFIPTKVNMGGLHYTANRKKYLSYLFLSDNEVEDIRLLAAKGISIYCQDVPTSKKYNIMDIINGK